MKNQPHKVRLVEGGFIGYQGDKFPQGAGLYIAAANINHRRQQLEAGLRKYQKLLDEEGETGRVLWYRGWLNWMIELGDKHTQGILSKTRLQTAPKTERAVTHLRASNLL